ncbi:MAG: CHRD domain-containing protein [Planctomycetota bacterium]|nr:CHRD domain-containing protein [Planctomycetota bacterium]
MLVRFLRLPAFFVVMALLGVNALDAGDVEFTASLDGQQANACQGTGSPATGTASFTLNVDTGELSFEITFEDGELRGPESAAHIHTPAERCFNAGVAVPLPLGTPKVGTAILMPQQVRALLDERSYVNIHTQANPGGEIRGQIVRVAQGVPAVSSWGTLLLVLALLAGGSLLILRLSPLAAPGRRPKRSEA